MSEQKKTAAPEDTDMRILAYRIGLGRELAHTVTLRRFETQPSDA